MNIVKKAGCILINMKEKKIALVLRNGDYSFPKGHLKEMETIKDCAKRETIEETGHEVEILGEEISIIRYKSSGGEDVENHLFIGIDTGRTNKKIAENICTDIFHPIIKYYSFFHIPHLHIVQFPKLF